MSNNQITFDKLNTIAQDIPQLYFDFYRTADMIEFKHINNTQHHMYHYPINTFALMNLMIDLNVSDITISEPLTFELNKVRKCIEGKNVKIRVCPHIAREDIAKDVGYGIEHFFILPQYIHLYNEYIDVCDLIDTNNAREKAIVELYTKIGSYSSALNLLIKNVGTEITSNFIKEEFFNRRISCGQICQEGPNRCHYCSSYLTLYDKLKQSINN